MRMNRMWPLAGTTTKTDLGRTFEEASNNQGFRKVKRVVRYIRKSQLTEYLNTGGPAVRVG